MIIKACGFVFLAVNLLNSNVSVIPVEIDCHDIKSHPLGRALHIFGSIRLKDFTAYFYIATRNSRDPVKIEFQNLYSLEKSDFNPRSQTLIIVHGYKSAGWKPWVVELKDKLLDAMDANIIIVDWSNASNTLVYIDAARHTIVAANKIFNFLQALRPRVEMLNTFSNDFEWSHLYFIGHSLGAQISGQTANLLKQDNFWTVDRITGLDPARPCFIELDLKWKLDKEDAKFVEIIHTQVGDDQTVALGLGENIGDIDFYINGGVIQPECDETKVWDRFFPITTEMMCSHRLSYKYFTNSIAERVQGGCSFTSYAWDGSYERAKEILEERIEGMYCNDCPEIGLNSVQSSKRGAFMVIATDSKPYCLNDGHANFSKVVEIINKLKGVSNIFSPRIQLITI